MNANPFALGAACFIFGLFNWIFVGGFFKTAYKFARPFVTYIVAAFWRSRIAEALHHIPGLEALNAFGTRASGSAAAPAVRGRRCCILLTLYVSCRKARAGALKESIYKEAWIC